MNEERTPLARQLPEEVGRVYFALRWESDAALRALSGREEEVRVDDLRWLLDLPFWASAPPEHIFDLAPRRVLDDPSVHPEHAARIDGVDLRWPLVAVRIAGRLIVLDGLHRLARAARDGTSVLPVVRVAAASLLDEPFIIDDSLPDYRGEPDDERT